MNTVAAALAGCYGVFVNTDTYTVGMQKEIFTGIKIYEVAKRTASMRHLIWSNLDYGSKVRLIHKALKMLDHTDIYLAWRL